MAVTVHQGQKLMRRKPGRGHLVTRNTVDCLAVGGEWEGAVPPARPTIQEPEVQTVHAVTEEIALEERDATGSRSQLIRKNWVAELPQKMPREPGRVVVAKILPDHVSRGTHNSKLPCLPQFSWMKLRLPRLAGAGFMTATSEAPLGPPNPVHASRAASAA